MARKRRIPAKFDRSNFPVKVQEIRNGKIVHITRKCVICRKRAPQHHHKTCDLCYNKRRMREQYDKN